MQGLYLLLTEDASLLLHSDGFRDSVCERWRFQFFPLGHFRSLLQFVVVDDVLVGRAALHKGVQLVHLGKVLPK